MSTSIAAKTAPHTAVKFAACDSLLRRAAMPAACGTVGFGGISVLTADTLLKDNLIAKYCAVTIAATTTASISQPQLSPVRNASSSTKNGTSAR